MELSFISRYQSPGERFLLTRKRGIQLEWNFPGPLRASPRCAPLRSMQDTRYLHRQVYTVAGNPQHKTNPVDKVNEILLGE